MVKMVTPPIGEDFPEEPKRLRDRRKDVKNKLYSLPRRMWDKLRAALYSLPRPEGRREAGIGDIGGIIWDKLRSWLYSPFLGVDSKHLYDSFQALRNVEMELEEEFAGVKLHPSFWELRRYKRLRSVSSENFDALKWYLVEKYTRNEKIREYMGNVIKDLIKRIDTEFYSKVTSEISGDEKSKIEMKLKAIESHFAGEELNHLTDSVIRSAYNPEFLKGISLYLANEILTGVMNAYKRLLITKGKSEEESEKILLGYFKPGDLVQFYTNMVESKLRAPVDYFIDTPINIYKHMTEPKSPCSEVERVLGESAPAQAPRPKKPFKERHPTLYKWLFYNPEHPWA